MLCYCWEICFLIAGEGWLFWFFPVKSSLSGADVRAALFQEALRPDTGGGWWWWWWGLVVVVGQFSITCLYIPRGTDDKETLSSVANFPPPRAFPARQSRTALVVWRQSKEASGSAA